MEKSVYITVRADEGPAHGRIHVKTDVTMAQLHHAYNQFNERNKGRQNNVNTMLKSIE